MVAKVTDLAVLHDDDELLQGEVALLVCHDVLVVEVFQQVDFEHGCLFLLLFES